MNSSKKFSRASMIGKFISNTCWSPIFFLRCGGVSACRNLLNESIWTFNRSGISITEGMWPKEMRPLVPLDWFFNSTAPLELMCQQDVTLMYCGQVVGQQGGMFSHQTIGGCAG